MRRGKATKPTVIITFNGGRKMSDERAGLVADWIGAEGRWWRGHRHEIADRYQARLRFGKEKQ